MKVIAITDLFYGDSGKGTSVDAIARQTQARLVVRHNGGCQAAHAVVTDDGRQHIFSQFGSATFTGAKTFLSQFMLINPLTMFTEAEYLQRVGVPDALASVYIDSRAKIVTPWHRAVNRVRAAAAKRHNTCGMGIGETVGHYLEFPFSALTAADLLGNRSLLIAKLKVIQGEMHRRLGHIVLENPGFVPDFSEVEIFKPGKLSEYADTYAVWASKVKITSRDEAQSLLWSEPTVIFEGAQGVLLDETHGFTPYNTWSDTTTNNVYKVLGDLDLPPEVLSLGVMRTYATRHGDGPLVTEQPADRFPREAHNATSPWQGSFRTGYLDLAAISYALRVSGPIDGLIVTWMDALESYLSPFKFAVAYASPISYANPDKPAMWTPTGPDSELLKEAQPIYQVARSRAPEAVLEAISGYLKKPVLMTSAGPTAAEKSPLVLLSS